MANDYRVLRSVPTYLEAQAIVDKLSDADFPVENMRIVGVDVETVEDVTGRRTTWTATWQAALAGVWFGFFLGLMFFIIFPEIGFFNAILWPIVFGAVFFGIFGAVSHAVTGGKRDFSSTKGLRANAYEVQVQAGFFEQAANLLTQIGYAPVERETLY